MKEKNIFENANFGDSFKAMNGEFVIYQKCKKFNGGCNHTCITKDYILDYDNNGKVITQLEDGDYSMFDIVHHIKEEKVDKKKLIYQAHFWLEVNWRKYVALPSACSFNVTGFVNDFRKAMHYDD